MEEVFAGLAVLSRFFGGCPIKAIDAINLQIALRHDYPDWLRHRPKISMLPRRHIDAERHTFVVGSRNAADVVKWAVENGRGRWDLQKDRVWFDDSTDAVQFKLTFC